MAVGWGASARVRGSSAGSLLSLSYWPTSLCTLANACIGIKPCVRHATRRRQASVVELTVHARIELFYLRVRLAPPCMHARSRRNGPRGAEHGVHAPRAEHGTHVANGQSSSHSRHHRCVRCVDVHGPHDIDLHGNALQCRVRCEWGWRAATFSCGVASNIPHQSHTVS